MTRFTLHTLSGPSFELYRDPVFAGDHGKGRLVGRSENPRQFEAWLNANGVVGSIIAIGIRAMASPDFIPVAGSLHPGPGFFFRSITRRVPSFGGLLGKGNQQALTVRDSKRYGETH